MLHVFVHFRMSVECTEMYAHGGLRLGEWKKAVEVMSILPIDPLYIY